MLHCCGGTGYKKRPLELERYLRDGKAGWVMGPTNEVLRQFVGKTALLGMESLDYWNQVVNRRAIENEVKKLSPSRRRSWRSASCRRPPPRAAARRSWGPAALGGGAPIAADPAVPQGSSEESPAGATVGAAGRASHPPHRWCRRSRARAHCSALLAGRCYAAELAVGPRACPAVPPWRRSSVG